MANLANIFRSATASGVIGGAPSREDCITSRGGCFCDFGPGRDWSGLRQAKRFSDLELHPDRVAVQEVLEWGSREDGQLVPRMMDAPFFVSPKRAERLIATGKFKFAGHIFS